MKTKTNKPLVVMAVTLLLIVLVFFISLNLGVIKIAPLKTLQVFFGQGTARDELVLFEFRMPRIILSLLVGAGISVAGAILQSVSQNELAEPGILGINAGGSLAVVLFIYFFQGSASDLSFFGTFIFAVQCFGRSNPRRVSHLYSGMEKRRDTDSADFSRHRGECRIQCPVADFSA